MRYNGLLAAVLAVCLLVSPCSLAVHAEEDGGLGDFFSRETTIVDNFTLISGSCYTASDDEAVIRGNLSDKENLRFGIAYFRDMELSIRVVDKAYMINLLTPLCTYIDVEIQRRSNTYDVNIGGRCESVDCTDNSDIVITASGGPASIERYGFAALNMGEVIKDGVCSHTQTLIGAGGDLEMRDGKVYYSGIGKSKGYVLGIDSRAVGIEYTGYTLCEESIKSEGGFVRTCDSFKVLCGNADYVNRTDNEFHFSKPGYYEIEITVDYSKTLLKIDNIGAIAPEDPEKPVEPETPIDPEKPLEPETPIDPEKPVEPETPTEPEKPLEPETPSNPEDSLDSVSPPQWDEPGGDVKRVVDPVKVCIVAVPSAVAVIAAAVYLVLRKRAKKAENTHFKNANDRQSGRRGRKDTDKKDN